MFAGAVRETVFSRPDVIERVSREFVPVALKAALINNPPGGVEGAYLAEVGRTKAAPQGIVAANKHGRILAWVLNFDDATQIPKFLDYVLEQNTKHPGPEPFDTPRFMHFPSRPMSSVPAIDHTFPKVVPHGGGDDFCPATPPKERGTIVARVWGQRLKDDGSHYEDATKQENYIEDVFDLSPALQERMIEEGAIERLPVSDAFARTVATYCYLGMLDVRPVAPPVPGHRSTVHELKFWARDGGLRLGTQHYLVEGTSDVESASRNRPGDGASFTHRVTLRWRGVVAMDGSRMLSLALWAEGRERLRWGNPNMAGRMGGDPASHLPAGRALDIDSKVVYGVIGAPVAAEDTWTGDGPAPGLGGRRPRPEMDGERGVQQKMRRLHQLLGKLMQRGKGREAAAAIDEVLRKLEALDNAKPADRDGDALARIERKMTRMQQLMQERRASGEAPGELGELMGRFGEQMGRGDMAGAEKTLDEALRRAAKK